MQKMLPEAMQGLIPMQTADESDLTYGKRILHLYRTYREFEGNGVREQENLFGAAKIMAENFRDTFGVYLGQLEGMSDAGLKAAREKKIGRRRSYLSATGTLRPGCIP